MRWEPQVIALLAATLVRPFALAAAAWLILRVFRVRHPASAHSVWTSVLIGMLLVPILSVISPQWRLLVLPRRDASALAPRAEFTPFGPRDAEPFVDVRASVKPVSQARERVAPASAVRPDRAQKRGVFDSPLTPWIDFVWLYFAGLFAMIAYRVSGWALLRRLVSRSTALREPWLRESGDILTPVAVGVLRPAVLLPSTWRDWSLDTRRAVLAHEFAHIRRNDALVSAFARFVKCVLWFHPLAWWVSRRVSDLAELACDEAVLQRTHDPAGYSRVLLAFADAVNRAGHRVALPGLAMASRSGMGRRIDQVFELSSGNMRKLARPGIALALLGAPVMCLAAALGLREQAPALPSFLLPVPRPPAPPLMLAQARAPLPAQALPQVQTPPQTQVALPAEPQPPLATNPPAAELPSTDLRGAPIDRGPNLYSKQKEEALGKQLAAEFERNVPLLDNPAALDYVSRLGEKLAAQLPDAPFSYTFAITATDPSNVLHEPISLPGGYIFISPALFRSAQDESEFAGMLAHAMAHVAARHGTRQATKAGLAQMATMPLMFYGGWTGFGARQSSSVLIPVAFLQFARSYEREADELAVKMTAGAGFYPESLVNYYRRVWTDNAPGTTARVFDATGSRDDRIATIESAIQKLTSPVSSTSSGEFLRIKEQIPEPQATPASDRPALRRGPQ